MKRPICYQQLFVSIKVCRLVSCDFMTMLGRRHAKSFIRKRADSCLNSWICEYLENMDFQRHCYIVHWHCSQCDGLEYHSNSKRSPLRLLRPARACGIEFHRLHIWFIWKTMDFCSYAGLSRVAGLYATQLLSTPLRCLINSGYLLEGISLLSISL